MNRLVVIGNDKIGRKFINSIEADKFHIVLDNSSSIKRVFNLIRKRRLSLILVMKMFLADFFRKDYSIRNNYEFIKSNNAITL